MGTEYPLHIIVGDCYSTFADSRDVLTVSDLQKQLSVAGKLDDAGVYVVGQGVSLHTRRELLSKFGLEEGNVNIVEPCDQLELTHKQRVEHVLISTPRKSGELTYAFDLSLGDEMDRLIDHISGHHISAMVLLEAGRQAAIACLLSAFPTRDDERPWKIVVDRFNVEFNNFSFPLPTELLAEIEISSQRPTLISTTVHVSVRQAGMVTSKMDLIGRLLRDDMLNRIESRSARQAIDQFRSGLNYRDFSQGASSK